MKLRKPLILLVTMVVAAIFLVIMAVVAAPSENTALAQATTPTPTPDNSLARVLENGKMVVGTSLPYEPFAFRTGLFKLRLDGFDIAVMQEIAKRMGVTVQFKDYAFEGLIGALRLNKFDAAIAAITITSERAEVVDFSQVYFRTAGAAITGIDSPLGPINSANDLAGLRIGIQTGTLYETWLAENFVRTGIGSSANIFAYKSTDTAVRDLKLNRLDVVLLDLPVAQNYQAEGDVRLVGVSEFRQSYAIALPKGAASLQTQFNLLLDQMTADGTMEKIAAAYNVTSLPEPDSGCINDLTYVADITYNDKNMTAVPQFKPNESFVKTWRVQNSGTCTWDPGYRLEYAYGNSAHSQMGGQPVNVTTPVAPGQTYDVSVNLTAPATPGTYQGIWQMTDGRGIPFGEKIYAAAAIPGAPPPPPGPTATPVPGISFTVDRTNIREGECVTFRWKVTNVREVYFYADGEAWQRHGVAGQSSAVECPNQTTRYNLRVVKTNGSVEISQITIYVEQTAKAPIIESFTANPTQILAGQCTNIRWGVSGSVDQVKILANNRPLWDGAPVSGNVNDCPPGAGNVVYSVEAKGPGGTARRDVSVRVDQPAGPTPTPIPPTPEPPTPEPPTPEPPTPVPTPPPPDAPVIQTFSAAPDTINLGECTTLGWQYGGQDLATAVITANGAPILYDPPPTGSISDCPGEPGQVQYRLDVVAEFGGRTSKDVFVTVQAETQPQPEPF